MTTLEEIKTVLIGKTIRIAGGREYGFIKGVRIFDAITTCGNDIIVEFVSTTGMIGSIFAINFNAAFDYHDGTKWRKIPDSYHSIALPSGTTKYIIFGYDEL